MKATEAYKETKVTGSVTKFKLVLLRAQQTDKLRKELLEQRINSLSRKPADWEDGELSVPKNYLLQVRIQAYFILRAERVKTWFPPDSRRDVSISSFLKSFTCGPGQAVSCELNNGYFSLSLLPGRQDSQRWAIMSNLNLPATFF